MKRYAGWFVVMLILILGSSSVIAGALDVGASINVLRGYKYQDQFEKKQTIHQNTRTLILTFEKGTGAVVNKYLSERSKGYLSSNKIQYIADISGMPGFAASMFALPKMRKYHHIILLNYADDFPEKIPHKDGKITLVHLNGKQKVVSLQFVGKDEGALKSALAQ